MNGDYYRKVAALMNDAANLLDHVNEAFTEKQSRAFDRINAKLAKLGELDHDCNQIGKVICCNQLGISVLMGGDGIWDVIVGTDFCTGDVSISVAEDGHNKPLAAFLLGADEAEAMAGLLKIAARASRRREAQDEKQESEKERRKREHAAEMAKCN